ncbi:MAG: hypothetical protein K6G11_04715 [Lachnospiraceae bacterium]|nr:hypothetical protein [Lachnospiraceae bacterium]
MSKRVKLIGLIPLMLLFTFVFTYTNTYAATAKPAATSTAKATATAKAKATATAKATAKATATAKPTATATAKPTATAAPTATTNASGSAVSDFSGAKNAIIAAYKSYATTVDVSKYNLNYETQYAQMKEMMSEIVNYTPYLFFTGTEYKVSRNSKTNIIVTISLGYSEEYLNEDGSVKKKKIKKDTAKIDDVVTKVKGLITSSMTKVEKALIIHDYIVDKTAYTGSFDKHVWSRELGALVKKKANSEGYSLAFKLLMDAVDVTNEIVTSDDMVHQWNKVKIGKAWYNVDCAWDDPIDSLTNKNQFGLIKHENFFCSDNAFAANGHTGFIDEDYPTKVKYDKKFWHNVTSRIFYHNSKWMYMGAKGIVERTKLLDKEFKIIYNVEGECMVEYTSNLYYFLYNNTLYLYNYSSNVTTPIWKCSEHYGSDFKLTQIKCVKMSVKYRVFDSTQVKEGSLQMLKSGLMA